MSEIIKLYNGLYEYKIPSPPSREEDILFIKEKKKNQYWRKQKLPDMKRMTVREKVDFIDQERDRWQNGVFFMNNGELTYINGLHYDHMTYMTFDEDVFYLDNQRYDFYFRELTWEHPMCRGRVIAKARRVGASWQEITEATYRSVEDFNRHVGLISIEEDKTKTSLFNPLIDSYVRRPKFMRPIFYKPNGKKPKQKLSLASDDIPEDAEIDTDLDTLELNSWCKPSATSASAFDAYKMHYIVADEVWKWKQASPKQFMQAHLKCFVRGGELVGKLSMLSTLGDTDDVETAIKEGVEIYQASDPKNLEKDGFTKSGLWKWFISAVYADHKEKDLYGKINVDKATASIMAERSKYEEGSQDYIYELRRAPLTEEEAMATAHGSTTFDNIRLQDRITIITKLPTAEKPYVIGKLHEDAVTEKVHFEKTNNGNWQVAWHPKMSKMDGIDRSNRWYKDANGILRMNKSPEGVFGYDPVQFGDKQTSSNNLSKSAIIGRYKFDYFGNKDKWGRSCAGMYAGLYHHRDEDPEISHYEFLKALKYWGFMGMHERLVNSVYTSFKDWHALSCLLKGDGKIYGLWTDGKNQVIKNGINRFQAVIKRPPIDQQHLDLLRTIPFSELLVQAKELNPADTRKSDIFMANTMMEAGLDKIHLADTIDEMLEMAGADDHTLATLFGR